MHYKNFAQLNSDQFNLAKYRAHCTHTLRWFEKKVNLYHYAAYKIIIELSLMNAHMWAFRKNEIFELNVIITS